MIYLWMFSFFTTEYTEFSLSPLERGKGVCDNHPLYLHAKKMNSVDAFHTPPTPLKRGNR